MTKQTVYLNNFARKSGFRLQFLRQSDDLSNDPWCKRMPNHRGPNSIVDYAVDLLYKHTIPTSRKR